MKNNNQLILPPTTLATRRGPVEYTDFGSGPAILSLHGAMGGHDQGQILIRSLGAPGYRYLAVSRPGYLGTPLSAGATPAAQANLYAELLDELGIQQAIVMAISGGGPSALEFAIRHPDRCRGLVLVSICSAPMNTPIPLRFKIMQLLGRWPAFVNLLRRQTEANPQRAARRAISDPQLLARTFADPEVAPLFKALQASTFDRMEQRLVGTRNDIQVTRATSYALEKVACPTLAIHGTLDRIVPYQQHALPLPARIPSCQLFAVEGGEHVALFTHRDPIRERVRQFLHEVSSTAA